MAITETVDANAWVRADRRRAVQAVINLLSNAIKYGGDAGDIRITCTTRPGNLWRIAVIDHGPGIPPETLAKLFRAFERGSADRSAIEGTGLGLVLSKRLVEAMRGSIGVASTEGAGTSFWVELPMAHVEPSAAPAGSDGEATPVVRGSIPPDIMDLLRVD